MVKISKELISLAAQYVNAIKEYELDLRGYKITSLSNLLETKDLFSCLNLSNNSISEIPILPELNNLNTLLLINNKISAISDDFSIKCPNLKNIILTNNRINSLIEINNLSSCKNLIRLSLVDNLITKIKNYRLYIIYKMPNLRVLDFQRITKKEKEKAKEFFEGVNGKENLEKLESSIKKNVEIKTNKSNTNDALVNEEVKKRIKLMIKEVKTYGELEELQRKIDSGEVYEEVKNELENKL